MKCKTEFPHKNKLIRDKLLTTDIEKARKLGFSTLNYHNFCIK